MFDKNWLIVIATTHPNVTVRRSAAHTLVSIGMLMGVLDMARADAKLQALANNAEATVAEVLAKFHKENPDAGKPS